MQSLVITRDGLQLADTPMPALMPGDVRIEVRSVGICETDVAIWKGEIDINLPLVLGHEFIGVIHESSSPELVAGTLVTAEIDIGCGRCWYCQRGENFYCTNKDTLGITRDGALSEYISVPSEIVHPLPMGIDRIAGTFVEPLASALHIYQCAPTKNDEPVLIVGCGEMGLLLAQVYDAFGAKALILGNNRWKLGVAKQLGMQNILNWETDNYKKRILDATEGVGPRIVVESTGKAAGIIKATETIRRGGTLILKRVHDNNIPISLKDIVQRGLTVIGSARGNFEEAIDILSKQRIEVSRIVSKEFNLEQGRKAFEYASDESVTKVIINI